MDHVARLELLETLKDRRVAAGVPLRERAGALPDGARRARARARIAAIKSVLDNPTD